MRTDVVDGMECLSIPECQDLLRGGGVGILALCGVAAPILRPVNFALHEGTLVIRTGEGRILEAAQGAEPASFSISQIDGLEHAGWSVIVVGKLSERSPGSDVAKVPLRPWVKAPKHHFIGLSIDEISGRRLADGPGHQ